MNNLASAPPALLDTMIAVATDDLATLTLWDARYDQAANWLFALLAEKASRA